MVELHGDQRGLVQDEKSKSVEFSGSTGLHGSGERHVRRFLFFGGVN